MAKFPFLPFSPHLLLGIFLTGCSVGPSYEPPIIPFPEEWHSTTAEGMHEGALDSFAWWEALDDPILNALLERAYDQNLDLSIAALRICETRLQRQGKSADMLPRIDGSVAGGGAHIEKNCITKHCKRTFGYFEAGFDAEWELDLFGKTAHEINAMDAKIESSEASFCDQWVTLSSEVGRNYIELRGLQQRLLLLNEHIKSQKETFELSQDLFKIGMVSTIEIKQRENDLSTLRVQKPQLEAAIDKAIYRLSLLLGLAPGDLYAELSVPRPLPQIPKEIVVGYPSELLRRRPDIRAAERELAAATEQVGTAVASLFPQISLKGFIGDICALGSSGATWLAGPQLLMPIFNSKLLEQDVKYNKLKAQEAYYLYQKTVLQSLEEAENAISAFRYELERNQYLGEAQKTSHEAYDLSLDLYQKGFKDYIELQLANRSQLLAKDDLIQGQVLMLLHYIALYKAFGGDF